MRSLICVAAIALITTSAPTAPAPRPKPGLTKEQQAVLHAAETDMAEANQLRAWELSKARADAGEQQETERKCRELNLAAALRLARLTEGLDRVAADVREAVTGKAGRAWLGAGEPAMALPYFDRVIAQSRDATRRVDALRGAYECRARLGRREEARALLALARIELPRLGKAEREAAQGWITAAMFAC